VFFPEPNHVITGVEVRVLESVEELKEVKGEGHTDCDGKDLGHPHHEFVLDGLILIFHILKSGSERQYNVGDYSYINTLDRHR